jgi:hypothetical protein
MSATGILQCNLPGLTVPGAWTQARDIEDDLMVRKFPFTFDTPNLLTGAVLYTPTPGDILLNGWIEVNTAWDGTTPTADFGYADGASAYGWLGDLAFGFCDMTQTEVTRHGLVTGQYPRPSGLDAHQNGVHARFVPGRLTGDPISVWVSQDGENGFGPGVDPASTQGAAVLYLVTATPV